MVGVYVCSVKYARQLYILTNRKASPKFEQACLKLQHLETSQEARQVYSSRLVVFLNNFIRFFLGEPGVNAWFAPHGTDESRLQWRENGDGEAARQRHATASKPLVENH